MRSNSNIYNAAILPQSIGSLTPGDRGSKPFMKMVGIPSVLSLLLTLPVLLSSNRITQASETMTPLLLAVKDAPVPFMGSDGRVHLVYELAMTNFSSSDTVVEKVEVISAGATLQVLDAPAIAGRLQPAGQRTSVGTLARGTHALLF